ncbi:ImmA/IrrE family metallo-endopeptidase [Sutterella sp.]|uniref:ImmA/IrrE family metallo-endopeptidase n=1 Tax=Sutterella sp. TaxID=1981025 RepID=UPI0026E0D96D|nr:ImmA/IrrE family metallo-endopeptidase [Sutterella sp.]MDO5531700.1 ImmA/IrrE family metallo-endopeptidase [Sutterella sp.]
MTETAVVAANDILEKFWDKNVPVDVYAIARELGLSVVEANTPTHSGYFSSDEQTIYINENESPVRKRFTIAHELGHFILGHGDSDRNTSIWSDRYSPEQMEKETAANKFATELLMPRKAISAMINILHITDAAELRKHLGVSSSALQIRLKSLGYIK